MNRYILIILLIFSSIAYLPAQINLIGARVNESTGGIDIATWNAGEPSSAVFYPTMLTGYYMASSVFDAYRSNYYLTGISDTSSGLFSFNSLTYEQTLIPYNNFSNISEIDMSTGKIYNLTMDSTDYFTVNEYDILSGTDSILGVIHEPGANGIVVDAISFDSNNGLLLYLGFDLQGNYVLYSISVRQPVFSYVETIVQAIPQNIITNLAYDNLNNRLFALQFEYNSGVNTPEVIEINTATGAITPRGLLQEFTGFVAGSTCFDQFSGSYMLVGIDSSNLFKLIIFDTYTNTYVGRDMPGNVSEIICNNYNFAQSAYGTTGVPGVETEAFTIFPNPSDGNVFVSVGEVEYPVSVKLFDLYGRECHSALISKPLTQLSVQHLQKGIYFAQLNYKDQAQTIKVVIQ